MIINLYRRTRKLFNHDNRFREKFGNFICGVDEAGRGPLAGPVVAAAVIFGKVKCVRGIYDSKQLTKEQREDLFERIKKNCLSLGIGIVRHSEIDRINILNATKIAMSKAINNLDYIPDIILADGNFYEHSKYQVINIVKGDTISYSIAAASIIAKVIRDRLMEKYQCLFPNFAFSKHKGYPTKQHIEEIRNHGLTEIHRRTFKVKSLIEVSETLL